MAVVIIDRIMEKQSKKQCTDKYDFEILPCRNPADKNYINRLIQNKKNKNKNYDRTTKKLR